jgi:hypothetical protein
MNGAETCRSGITVLNILFTLHMHFVGFNSFQHMHLPTLPDYQRIAQYTVTLQQYGR